MTAEEVQRAAQTWDEVTDNEGRELEIQKWICGIKEGQTRSQYIACRAECIPFAIVKDGKWYEKGKMGWWGMVSDEQLGVDWHSQAKMLMEDLPDDTLLTIVDCHI